MSLGCLARAYCNNKQALSSDNGRCETSKGTIVPVLNSAGNLEDAKRVLTHPTLGTYEYPINPDITNNFIYAPTRMMDSTINRTIGSNILVSTKQKNEDIIITERWQGGGNRLSTLSEMARQFYDFWMTELDVGESFGWEPLDVTSDRYLVSMVTVLIGGSTYEYKEARVADYESADSYLTKGLTIKLKMEKGTIPSTGEVTLVGA